MFQITALGVLLGLHPMAAQERSGKLESPVFRSTTRLVQINVVVHGKGGKPVDDLKKEDFTVFEKGKPQTVSFFGKIEGDKLVTSREKLPPNIFSNHFGDKTAVPASVTVILIDSLNTSWADQIYARQQVVRFLKQIQPSDRVALYTLGRGLRVLHDYTTDASALVARLNRWRGDALPDLKDSELRADDPLLQVFGNDPGMLAGEQQFADFIAGNRVLNTLHALEAIGEHLAAVPGRKSLVWVSGGFPLQIGFDDIDTAATSDLKVPVRDRRTFFDEVEKTLRALNHADVAVYPVDARGLMVDPQFSADRPGRSVAPPKIWSPPNLDTMNVLADRTGGKAYYNRNDLDRAIRDVFTDTEVTYTLGYYSANPETDGKFRELKVKVNRPGVNVRARKGYFAFADLKQDDEKMIKSQMANAIWSPLDATAVSVNARVDKMENGMASIYVQIDPATTTLTQNQDRWSGRIDLAFVFKTEDGKSVGGQADNLTLNLTKPNYLQAIRKGFLYHRAMAIPPTAKTLRIVVRDAPSGLAGSLTVPMSQVALFVPPPKPAAPPARTPGEAPKPTP